MFRILTSTLCRNLGVQKIIGRTYAKVKRKQQTLKVCVCGAMGRCGEAVALTMKLSPYIDEVSLYDIVNTYGLTSELNLIDTSCHVTTGKLKDTLEHAKIVVILASAPAMMTSDLLKLNARIVRDIMTVCAQHCPQASIVIGTNPVNSLVPVASAVLQKHGVYNANRVFGVTTLDVMRTNKLVAECHGLPIESVHVPVIGGHSVDTVVPILSQTVPPSEFTNDELEEITRQVRELNDFTCVKKHGGFVLSGAMAVSRLVIALARGIKGEQNIQEYAYVRCNVYPHVEYLATRVELGLDGIKKHLALPQMSDYEKCLLHNAVNVLVDDIKMGEDIVNKKAATCEPKVSCAT